MTARRALLRSIAAGGALLATARFSRAEAAPKRPRAIAMWDFSWLERRWPGAGFEDWDRALDELADRGYDAVRIDAYPHLVAADGHRTWLLKPQWDTQDWGSPTLVRVQVLPALLDFIGKCRDRAIKVGLSTWFREDEHNVRRRVRTPADLAHIWHTTLTSLKTAGLWDALLYVDLCNEWPGHIWSPLQHSPPVERWSDPLALQWMRDAIAALRASCPDLPLLFSTDNEQVEDFADQPIDFMDGIEHHLWMAGENDDEYYRQVGYAYQRFSEAGYRHVQLNGERVYHARRDYWNQLLTAKIARLARAARHAQRPLLTTECWAIVDYKDWPMLPWDWVKALCELGTETASATGQWMALATSNFCAPQFHGMWGDVEWHRRLTRTIKQGPLDAGLRVGRLWDRL